MKVLALGDNDKFVCIASATGTGKTRFLHTLCNEVKDKRNAKKILFDDTYYTTQNIIKHIQEKTYDSYIADILQYDAVFLDQFEHVSGKSSSQLEFMHLFDVLLQHGTFIGLALCLRKNNTLDLELLHVLEKWMADNSKKEKDI